MSNLFHALRDGSTVAATHWQVLAGTLLLVFAGSWLMYAALKGIFGDRFTAADYYSLSLGGWLLPASLISLLWYLLRTILSPEVSAFVVIGLTLLAMFALSIRSLNAVRSPQWTVLLLALLTILFVVLRLAFISRALFPLYFDSAQHYLFARDILSDATWTLTGYYHLGFHFLAAFLTLITRAQINDTMLVLGQVILALMPFPFFFIVHYETQSGRAGIFAILLAAFGWYMPAHAMDWGKYPALASLALLPFVLSLASLALHSRKALPPRRFWVLVVICLFGVLIAIVLHSRALIVFAILAGTWLMTSLWTKLPRPLQLVALAITILALMALMAWIQKKGILGPLFDPYSSQARWITVVVLLLSIFAYRLQSRLVFFCLVTVGLALASLFISLGSLIRSYANVTLLDRPFLEMILYLPLTLLGGFGLAGLESYLSSRKIPSRAVNSIGILFILLVAVHAFIKYDLYPSNCCVILSQDDLQAIQWIDMSLPQDTRILVSSTELNVLPTTNYQGSAGGDAGTWINPLIRRFTVFMPFNTDFNQPQTLDTICQLNVGYVYVGGTGWFFNDGGMSAQPDRYKLLFSLPKAKVYQVLSCT